MKFVDHTGHNLKF